MRYILVSCGIETQYEYDAVDIAFLEEAAKIGVLTIKSIRFGVNT